MHGQVITVAIFTVWLMLGVATGLVMRPMLGHLAGAAPSAVQSLYETRSSTVMATAVTGDRITVSNPSP